MHSRGSLEIYCKFHLGLKESTIANLLADPPRIAKCSLEIQQFKQCPIFIKLTNALSACNDHPINCFTFEIGSLYGLYQLSLLPYESVNIATQLLFFCNIPEVNFHKLRVYIKFLINESISSFKNISQISPEKIMIIVISMSPRNNNEIKTKSTEEDY